ncbi:MAG TPA: hypothetical protein VM223_02205 [Planctomycetota bacterium]|nr:hypothetical protein [Planctomycetota bacterium]
MAGLLVPFIIGAFATEELVGLAFGVVAMLLALVFGILGWKQKTGKVTVIAVACVGGLSVITLVVYFQARRASEHKSFARARQAVEQLGEPSSADLVFIGIAENIEVSALGEKSLTNWIVTFRIEKVLSGEFANERFSFRIHSPSMSGFEVGQRYMVEAEKTDSGYKVDQDQWRLHVGHVGQ